MTTHIVRGRMMTRLTLIMGAVLVLAGCSGGGGGGDSSTTSSAPSPPPSTPTAQPDMLTATNQGLLRGKASGQGQHLIFSQPNMHQQFNLMVNGGNVVYARTKSEFDGDIWTVRTDGTGDRPLANTQDDENARALKSPWMLYAKQHQQFWSINLDTGAQFLIHDDEGLGTDAFFYGTDRVMMNMDHELFSNTVTGGNRFSYISTSDGDTYFYVMHITDTALIYRRDNSGPGTLSALQLFAVPLAGGNHVQLDAGKFYTSFAAAIGHRMVYSERPQGATPSDIGSINADGTGRVVLASHPANEAVQGVTTDQVIIRRNLSGNDQLIAVPVVGGAERLLMTMTDSEFVDLIVGDLIIVRRPSGTWSLDLNGTLTKLGTVAGDAGFIAVGNAVCLNKGTAVWCMPLDGTGQAVKIADVGKVEGAL